MGTATQQRGLDQKAVESYWNSGYLFPLRGLSEDEAGAARAELEALEREWLDNGLPLPLNTYKRVNAHVVIEEYIEPVREPVSASPALVVLSAKNETRLRERIERNLSGLLGPMLSRMIVDEIGRASCRERV